MSIAVTDIMRSFGLNSGNNTSREYANTVNAMRFVSGDDGTLSKIGLLINQTSPQGNVKVAIYSHDTANNLSENLLWGSPSTRVTNGWMEWQTSPVSLTKGNVYWLAFWFDTSNGVRYQSGAGRHVWWNKACGDWSATLDNNAAGSNTNQYVMLATYTIR